MTSFFSFTLFCVLSQTCLSYHFFQTPKSVHLLLSPSPAPALTDTTTAAMPACTFALTQPTVKFSCSRLLTGCACYPCGFAIVVVNVCITGINRCTLSCTAISETLSFLRTHWHPIENTFMTNSTVVSICCSCIAHNRYKNNQFESNWDKFQGDYF